MFHRRHEQPGLVLADILRPVTEAPRPLSGPAAVALAERVQTAIGEAGGAAEREDMLRLMLRAGSACEVLKLGGWRSEAECRARPDECAQAVDRFVTVLTQVRNELVDCDPEWGSDPYPAVTDLHTGLMCLRRLNYGIRLRDPIDEVRECLAHWRATPDGPGGFTAVRDRLLAAGDELLADWPATPTQPTIAQHEAFFLALRRFERAASEARLALRTLHPRLTAWPTLATTMAG